MDEETQGPYQQRNIQIEVKVMAIRFLRRENPKSESCVNRSNRSPAKFDDRAESDGTNLGKSSQRLRAVSAQCPGKCTQCMQRKRRTGEGREANNFSKDCEWVKGLEVEN